MSSLAADASIVRLHAAGSLRTALTEVTRAYTAASGVRVDAVFGASGLLRERLSKGEPGGVFASANMEHPQALAAEGKSDDVRLFARNRLCALLRPGLALVPDTLLGAMLDPKVKLGTSTPLADPSGDYAWEVFRKADAIRPGSRTVLEAKALKLTGGADSAQPPAGSNPYAWHLREGRADVFLAYCTGAKDVMAEVPGATSIGLPAPLATGADYGLTVLKSAGQERARALAQFILSAEGQRILAGHGFQSIGEKP